MRKNYLHTKRSRIEKASFPVIDAHNHLWGNLNTKKVIETMDAAGIVKYCDLTGNVHLEFADGGYVVGPADIHDFFEMNKQYHPERFYCFTMSEFARPVTEPLFHDDKQFIAEFKAVLREHVSMGAKGLKVLKELGLHFSDSDGKLIHVDDPRLFPIWEEAASLNIPVLIHQADPSGFFEAVTPENEHYNTLKKYPSWGFNDAAFPRKEDLLKRRDKIIMQHPDTVFILPHVANYAENISYVTDLLHACPNVYIDFSARLDELGRQPYSSRKFFIEHQDRIIFGTDMPANIESSLEMYRTYFRFLETFDEAFYAPDYDGTFDRARWPICGIGLPDEVLEKIYYKNILKIIPDLEKDLEI